MTTKDKLKSMIVGVIQSYTLDSNGENRQLDNNDIQRMNEDILDAIAQFFNNYVMVSGLYVGLIAGTPPIPEPPPGPLALTPINFNVSGVRINESNVERTKRGMFKNWYRSVLKEILRSMQNQTKSLTGYPVTLSGNNLTVPLLSNPLTSIPEPIDAETATQKQIQEFLDKFNDDKYYIWEVLSKAFIDDVKNNIIVAPDSNTNSLAGGIGVLTFSPQIIYTI